jgi:3,4-dihydroxy 2-butanone 4-phosphate synthase/GTP cyclohydrolase II
MNDTVESVRRTIDAFKRGEIVMVMDRIDRENECDLVLSGEACTPEKMAFMIKFSTGIICVVADQDRLEAAGLYPAVHGSNTDKNSTNFYVSTDYLPTTTTGVSAADRCETVLALCDKRKLIPADFSKPGHMFPLCSRRNGLHERDGHTESAYDLCRLAGVTPVSIIGEMMHSDGTMMRLDDCLKFSKDHSIEFITVPELKDFVLSNIPLLPPQIQTSSESTLELASSCKIRVDDIDDMCTLMVFRHTRGTAHNSNLETEVVALVRGDVSGKFKVPVRVHSECFTGDILASLRCDCGPQLHNYMREVMGKQSPSCLIYVRGHEGRGIGLANKVKCYRLQDEEHLDTVDANLRLGFQDDHRTFGDCREALFQLGVRSVSLYTNNPGKASALGDDLVGEVVALPSVPNGVNDSYLLTKQNRMKHKTVIETMKWNELLSTPSAGQKGELPSVKIAVVSAIWNDEYVSDMLSACLSELASNNVQVEAIRVPGAMDLVAGAKCCVRRHKDVKAVIAIGVLIRGDTDIYENNCAALASSVSHLNTMEGMPPVVSGILMYKSEAQACARLESDESRKLGVSWAKSAISMARLY